MCRADHETKTMQFWYDKIDFAQHKAEMMWWSQWRGKFKGKFPSDSQLMQVPFPWKAQLIDKPGSEQRVVLILYEDERPKSAAAKAKLEDRAKTIFEKHGIVVEYRFDKPSHAFHIDVDTHPAERALLQSAATCGMCGKVITPYLDGKVLVTADCECPPASET